MRNNSSEGKNLDEKHLGRERHFAIFNKAYMTSMFALGSQYGVLLLRESIWVDAAYL